MERKPKPTVIVCEYCGREVLRNAIGMHRGACVYNPAIRERLIVALTSDAPGVGVSMADYKHSYQASGVPTRTTLMRNFGNTWGAVLSEFGLALPKRKRKLRGTKAEGQEQTAIAEAAAELEETRRILAEDAAAAHSLAVARVKPAPGLRVNGRECVACELR